MHNSDYNHAEIKDTNCLNEEEIQTPFKGNKNGIDVKHDGLGKNTDTSNSKYDRISTDDGNHGKIEFCNNNEPIHVADEADADDIDTTYSEGLNKVCDTIND